LPGTVIVAGKYRSALRHLVTVGGTDRDRPV